MNVLLKLEKKNEVHELLNKCCKKNRKTVAMAEESGDEEKETNIFYKDMLAYTLKPEYLRK